MNTVCNRCGKEILEVNLEPCQDVVFYWGYESKFDCETWRFGLCEDCILEIIKEFEIVPGGFMIDHYKPLTKEQHQKTFDNWKETGEWKWLKYVPYEQFREFGTVYSKEFYEECIEKYYPEHINDIRPINNKILINGRGGSGKDTLADYLVENYGFKKIAFADGIYDIARKYFNMEVKDRRTLQLIGEKMREINPNIWVDYTFEKAEKYDKVVISDCRQFNEYEKGLNSGFLPIRIETDLEKRIERLEKRDGFYPDVSLFENKCETGADDLEFITVDNNDTYEQLYEQIEAIIKFDWTEIIMSFQKELSHNTNIK